MRYWYYSLILLLLSSSLQARNIIPSFELCNRSSIIIYYEIKLTQYGPQAHDGQKLWPEQCKVYQFDKSINQQHLYLSVYTEYQEFLYDYVITDGEAYDITQQAIDKHTDSDEDY